MRNLRRHGRALLAATILLAALPAGTAAQARSADEEVGSSGQQLFVVWTTALCINICTGSYCCPDYQQPS